MGCDINGGSLIASMALVFFFVMVILILDIREYKQKFRPKQHAIF